MDLGLKGKRALVMSSSARAGPWHRAGAGGGGGRCAARGPLGRQAGGRGGGDQREGAGRAHWVGCDLSDDAADTLARAVADTMGAADILVANTGGAAAGQDGRG
ncbi:MAG: hypothetical protein R3D46_08845 [Defluviimonas denitrificans]